MLLATLLAAVALAGCGDGDGAGGRQEDERGESVSLEQAVESGEATVLRRTTVFDTDPLGINGPALTMLVPDGWTVQGGPVWRHQYSNLATFEGVVASPDGFEAVQYFPTLPQIWQQGGIAFFPEGSIYLGNEVRPPIGDAAAFLEALVLPAYRGGVGPRIIAREPLPAVAAMYVQNSLAGTEVIAERILTEHVFNGVAILEEFTVVLSFTPNPAIPGALVWKPEQLFSVRAPASEFEEARPVLQAIATSPVVDRDWFAAYSYVVNLSIQNGFAAIRSAGEMSRIITEANQAISDTILESYNQTQAANDRIFDAVSQTIRGVETYTDPFEGGTIELPNEYSYAYASEEGNVILTNEPGFDPVRAFPAQTWETLTIQR
jgi:hypothetical protein